MPVNRPRSTMSLKAGLVLPVGYMHNRLKAISPLKISKLATVKMVAAIEYVLKDLLELIAWYAGKQKRIRRTLTTRHLVKCLEEDTDLDVLFDRVIIPSGGIQAEVNSALLPKKGKSGRKSKRGAIISMTSPAAKAVEKTAVKQISSSQRPPKNVQGRSRSPVSRSQPIGLERSEMRETIRVAPSPKKKQTTASKKGSTASKPKAKVGKVRSPSPKPVAANPKRATPQVRSPSPITVQVTTSPEKGPEQVTVAISGSNLPLAGGEKSLKPKPSTPKQKRLKLKTKPKPKTKTKSRGGFKPKKPPRIVKLDTKGMEEISKQLAPFLTESVIAQGPRTMVAYESLPDVQNPSSSSSEESASSSEEEEEEFSSPKRARIETVESASEIEVSEFPEKTKRQKTEPLKFVMGVNPLESSIIADIQRTTSQLKRASAKTTQPSAPIQGKKTAGMLMRGLTGKLV